MSEQGGADDVGSLGEEASRLWGVLSGWARDHGPELAQGLSSLAEQAAVTAREVGDHLDTGSAECDWCPVCRTVHLVRESGPEVREQLATAATSLVQAATGLLVAAARDPRGDDRAGVERIDLDEDPDEWPEDAP